MNLQLKQIRIDGGTQSRVEINNDVVSEYVEALKNGASFPQLIVFFDGVDYWLVDGFHRYHAHKLACMDSADCDVHNGSLREAQLFSVGVNDTHGLRRSNADKHKSVEFMLNDSEWTKWSDNSIAKQCAVTQPFVSKIRSSLITVISEDENQARTFTTKHGTQAVMNTEKIGLKTNKVESDSTELQNKPNSEPESTEPESTEPEYTELDQLRDDNSELRDRIVDLERLCQIAGIDTGITDDVLNDAKKQIKDLEANLKAVTASRDFFMNENAQLKRQLKLNKKVA